MGCSYKELTNATDNYNSCLDTYGMCDRSGVALGKAGRDRTRIQHGSGVLPCSRTGWDGWQCDHEHTVDYELLHGRQGLAKSGEQTKLKGVQMQMRFTCALLSLALGACALIGTARADSTISVSTQTHGSWGSRIVRDREETRFRAHTSYSEDGDVIYLVVDRLGGSCDVQYITFNIAANTPATSTFTSDPDNGAMRVDEYPVRKITYTLSLEKGERVFFATVRSFESGEELLREMRVGKTLRVKLKQGDSEYFLRFPLSGFVEAERRTKALCKTSGVKGDKEYFKEQPKPSGRPDRSYFPPT
jgi:hypothetical protein